MKNMKNMKNMKKNEEEWGAEGAVSK